MATCPECHAGYPSGTEACPLDGTTLVSGAGGAAPYEGALTEPSVPGAPPPEASDPLLGTTLAGRFRVTARIGYGGMGIVYRATHTVIGREVALKVLHERHADRTEVAARLVNEARLASSIQNEHIVDIFDSGLTADGRTFVVMELLDGESLAQVIRREGALPEARAVDICLQVADGIGAAHARGIIHRDVKPENIFLSQRDGGDFVKVLDFGISKAMRGDVDGAERLTHTGMVLGTPLYMSPEQARGEEVIDHRIDVYALGVILYECLTGEVPFRGANYLGIISDVLSRVPPSPRQLRPDLGITVAVERACVRAMARDRETRYASMAELAADLRRVKAGEPVALLPAAEAPALAAAGARKAVMWASILGVALVVTGVTALIAWRSPGPALVAPEPAHAVEPPSPQAQPAALPKPSIPVAAAPPGPTAGPATAPTGALPTSAPSTSAPSTSAPATNAATALDRPSSAPTASATASVAPPTEKPPARAATRPKRPSRERPAASSGEEVLPVSKWPGETGGHARHAPR